MSNCLFVAVVVNFDVPIENFLVGIAWNVHEPCIPFRNDLTGSKDEDDGESPENAEVNNDIVSMNVRGENWRNDQNEKTLTECSPTLQLVNSKDDVPKAKDFQGIANSPTTQASTNKSSIP